MGVEEEAEAQEEVTRKSGKAWLIASLCVMPFALPYLVVAAVDPDLWLAFTTGSVLALVGVFLGLRSFWREIDNGKWGLAIPYLVLAWLNVALLFVAVVRSWI